MRFVYRLEDKMQKLNILCVDDQREILAALKKDLQVFSGPFSIIDCESANETEEVLEELDRSGKPTALIICDHVMPEKSGIDFLIDINNDARFEPVKKLLLTGLANHQDTITAINKAEIDRYIEKPWEIDELVETVQVLITEFVLETGIEYGSFQELLDQKTLYKALHKRG